MGTFFTCGATKASIIEEIIRPLQEKDHLVRHKVCKEDNGGESVLWTVEKGEREGEPYQFIGCYILRKADGNWGYKPMDETMGPCFDSVPIEWLDEYPCIVVGENATLLQGSKDWRADVKAARATSTTK